MVDESFTRNMSISHAEFHRTLEKAVGSYAYEVKDEDIIISIDNGEIIINLAPEEQRKIASLCLPSTNVSFQIKNVAKKTKEMFFDKFEHTFRRGGG